MEKKIAVIGVIVDDPENTYQKINSITAEYRNMIRGRLGVPMPEENISAISLIVIGSADEINTLTGKLGNIQGVSVKTALSKKEL